MGTKKQPKKSTGKNSGRKTSKKLQKNDYGKPKEEDSKTISKNQVLKGGKK